MLEKQIEAHLVKRCKEIGALCEKFTSPQRRSVPDRIVTNLRGIYFVELKAPGKRASEAQLRDHAKRRKAGGVSVHVIDSLKGVDAFIDAIGLR
jgi:hypothetical protein